VLIAYGKDNLFLSTISIWTINWDQNCSISLKCASQPLLHIASNHLLDNIFSTVADTNTISVGKPDQ
jgi:hypothetical protein